ncbi:hypothetical protein [Spirosoma aerolatum]|uniref:hypothetical protein n=1 Tax=Spirosoma aerolatum TaxID=1211326 RepID=UPI0009AF1715|nr:hypothetical protein [Spirosoma aerolatum]
MNVSVQCRILRSLCLYGSLLISLQSFGQYGGYGGYGGYGSMGRRMGGNFSQDMTATSRSNIPNIAGELAQRETKWIKENLSPTKDQLKAIKQLNTEYGNQQQSAIKDIIGTSGKPTPESRKQIEDMMLMLNEEKEDKLKGILTPEQWSLYQSKKPEMQKAVGGWRPSAPKGTTTQSDSTGTPKQ